MSLITLREVDAEVVSQIEHDLGHKTEADLKSIMIAGLAEEAGEVAGLFKRELRDFEKDRARCTTEKYVEELGDVLWYLAGVAYTHGITLEEIWEYNMKKLEERYG